MKTLSQILSYPIRKVDFIIRKKQFAQVGKCFMFQKPLRINGAKNIFIGDNVKIHDQVWLAAMSLTRMGGVKLEIGDGCVLGDYNHIFATHSIIFERNVLTANNVYISDNLHEYQDINLPILKQPIKQLKNVVIGEGSWLGQHVCVIGASIGKHCVIGANSVVTHDIPDYCVAVGSPARIIRRYNPEDQQWHKTDKIEN